MADDQPAPVASQLIATSGSAPVAQLPPAAADVYATAAAHLYEIAAWFLAEPEADRFVHAVAQDLPAAISSSGYGKYSRLVCLGVACERLAAYARLKAILGLSVGDSFALLLHDLLGYSCFELGAILGISEGTARTRLDRARAKAFPRETDPVAPRAANASHLCYRARDLVEDWVVPGKSRGKIRVPAQIAREIEKCPRCEAFLGRRLASLEYFAGQPAHSLPARLEAFPITPLFVRQNKRLVLNWAAAPWYVKAIFEGLLAATLVVGIVLSIPRIRSFYELWMERRIDLYGIAELAAGLGSRPEYSEPKVAASEAAIGKMPSVPQGVAAAPGGEAADAADEEEDAGRTEIKSESEFVGRDSQRISPEKIYRVFIKTDSPEMAREQVVRILKTAQYAPAEKDTAVGAEVPGGIMFDAFIPLRNYSQLKVDLYRAWKDDAKGILARAKETRRPGAFRLMLFLMRN